MTKREPVNNTSVKGRWKPGASGNPRGRPRGSRCKRLLLLDQIGDASAAKLLRATIKSALGGDTQAQSLLLARLWPVGKGRPVSLPLGDVSAPDGLVSASAAVIA